MRCLARKTFRIPFGALLVLSSLHLDYYLIILTKSTSSDANTSRPGSLVRLDIDLAVCEMSLFLHPKLCEGYDAIEKITKYITLDSV